MTNLPNGWAEITLGDITVDCSQRVPAGDEEFSYVDISSVDRGTKKIAVPQRMLGKNAPSRARKEIRTGDVLVSMTRPNLNGVALVPASLNGQIASTGFDVLRVVEVDPRWLYYIVRSRTFVDAMSALVQGALYPAIKSKDVRSFKAVLAPLSEQCKIVDKLDDLLTRVDVCRARLDRFPNLAKQFRQAMLYSAANGELTRDWRSNQSEAAEWNNVELRTLIVEGPKNGLYKPASAYGDGTRILRIDNFYDGFTRPWEELKRLHTTAKECSDYGLAIGDIVINRVNSFAYLGKAALIRDLPEEAVFESNMMRIRLDQTRIDPGYAIAVLTSPLGKEQLRRNAKHAVNQASINQDDVQSVVVPLPSLPEQREIVARLQRVFESIEEFERHYIYATKIIERLGPAILAKAFRGELVPQDPNDEPASVLLERIRAAKSASSAAKPKRSRKPQSMAEA